MKTQKQYETKPLKNHDKYNDDFFEALLAKRQKDKEVKKETVQPSKSYKKELQNG